MKALSIRQPFAQLIVDGLKTIETRTWDTTYRGDLLICAAQNLHRGYAYAFNEESCQYEDIIAHVIAMRQTGIDMPIKAPFYTGHAIGIVTLDNVRPMTRDDEPLAFCRWYERAFAWELSNPRKITPFPVKGYQGFFNVELP